MLTTFCFEFLELFLPEIAARIERESLQFLDKEVFTDVTAGDRHRADLVARARWKEAPPGQENEAFLVVVLIS